MYMMYAYNMKLYSQMHCQLYCLKTLNIIIHHAITIKTQECLSAMHVLFGHAPVHSTPPP